MRGAPARHTRFIRSSARHSLPARNGSVPPGAARCVSIESRLQGVTAMTRLLRIGRIAHGCAIAALSSLLVACGRRHGSRSSERRASAWRPAVTATSPAASTPAVTGVDTTGTVSATFSAPMTASTLTTTSFTLACPAATPVTGTVTYDAPSKTATLTPAAALPAATLCTATITTAATDSTGIPLAANFAWNFMTAASTDVTRPTVTRHAYRRTPPSPSRPTRASPPASVKTWRRRRSTPPASR